MKDAHTHMPSYITTSRLLTQLTASYLENFESGNIKNADEVLPLVLRLQRLVTAGDQPQEHSGVDGFGQSCH